MDEPSMDKKDFVKQVAAALYVGGIDTVYLLMRWQVDVLISAIRQIVRCKFFS